MSAPDIFEYLSFRQWLRDWFEWKKVDNPRYSHRLFARRAGQSSPSTLIQIIDGSRNLSEVARDGFIRALDLDEEEARFFTRLVAVDQGSTPRIRSQALEEVLATQRFRDARPLEGDLAQVLARWHYAAIYELACCADFREDPAWIGATLRPRITAEYAADALALLERVGMLERDDSGALKPLAPRLEALSGLQGLVMTRYQAAMLKLAQDSVYDVGEEERLVLGFTTAIDSDKLPELRQRVQQFVEELFGHCSTERSDRVMQLSLAFFPLSRGSGEEE
jgi:uncharacterized protein (TIGR02147 family)